MAMIHSLLILKSHVSLAAPLYRHERGKDMSYRQTVRGMASKQGRKVEGGKENSLPLPHLSKSSERY